jgi:hypothetical protein
MASRTPPRLVSPFVLAELDYLIASRVGHQAQMALIDEVARGAYQLESFSSEDVGHAKRIMERYDDLRIGLADASVAFWRTVTERWNSCARTSATSECSEAQAVRRSGCFRSTLEPA